VRPPGRLGSAALAATVGDVISKRGPVAPGPLALAVPSNDHAQVKRQAQSLF